MSSDAILARRVDLTYRQFPVMAAVSMLTAGFFAETVAHSAGPVAALLWFGLATAVMVWRFVLYRQYMTSAAPQAHTHRWRRHLFIGAVGGGLVWGSAALFYLAANDANDRIFVVVVAVSLATTGANWHAAFPRASAIYALTTLAPFTLAIMVTMGQSHLTLAAASILLMIILIAIARRSGQQILEWCVQAEKNSTLGQHLEAARIHLEAETEQRRQADAHRDRYGRKLDLLIRQTSLATIEWDEEQRVTEWNPAAEALFGYGKAEAIGRRDGLDLLFSEAHRREASAQWWQESGKGEGFQISTENITRDGRVLACSWAVTPLMDGDGRWIGTIAQARDITAKRAAFRALEESRRRLEEAQELAHIGHWEWDFVGQRGKFSREALRLFGRPESWCPSPDEIDGLIVDADETGFMERVRRAGAGHLGEIVIQHRLRDGADDRQIHTSIRMEYDQEGNARRFIAAMQDVTELHKYEQKLHSLAFYDPLTGLPNRALFNDRMRQGIAEVARHPGSMGLMLLDLDRFKAINDTLGHSSGDQLLREAATRLSRSVRCYDTVARLGGDEFAILLPEIRNAADLGSVARKIVGAFAEPFRVDDREFFITCSVGVVMFPQDGSDATELMRNADLAMYDAKAKGRNNFQFYSTALSDRSTERMTLDAELRQAERNGEFELHYQPQVDLRSGRLLGVEALLRWNHPDRGLVMPDRFIGLAEETGLIVGIGEWVLRTACTAARRWNENRTDGIVKVSVNLSPRQFRMNDIVGTIRRVLAETQCRPAWLACEITESLLLDDHDDIRAMLIELHMMGIALAIDDFGTGYSSLAYLNRYPVQCLKIDRSFVRDMMTAPDSAELVKAIISMARSLRLDTVAEGVETTGQQEFLAACGCTIGQGWLYGKAVPQAQIEALLDSASPPWHDTPAQSLMFEAPCLGGVAS